MAGSVRVWGDDSEIDRGIGEAARQGAGSAVKRVFTLIVSAALLAVLASGCGGDREKGVNSNKDRPKADKSE
jgi:hypothetical protein